jgi:Lhr-like helicase
LGRDLLGPALAGCGPDWVWQDTRSLFMGHGLDGFDPSESLGITVLYVSPLKALAVDIDRKLRAPIAGIARVRGHDLSITTSVRSGDTTPAERRRLVTRPPTSDQFGIEAQLMAADDGIVSRLPEDGGSDTELQASSKLLDLLVIDPATLISQITTLVGSSAVVASRFRECASCDLLFVRKDPGRRAPLWQQRQRSAQLLTVAAYFKSFSFVLETEAELVQDVYDVPVLSELMTAISDGSVSLMQVQTTTPSPMARSLLFGYVPVSV